MHIYVLARRTASDEVLHDKTCEIPSNFKYGGCQRGLTSMVSKFFYERFKGSRIKNEVKPKSTIVYNIDFYSAHNEKISVVAG